MGRFASLLCVLLLLPPAGVAYAQVVVQEFPESGPIALDGNVLLIAGADGPVVYEYVATTWVKTADLAPLLDPNWKVERGDFTGAVAAGSGWFTVLFRGVVYVFEKKNGAWRRSGKLTLDASEYTSNRSGFGPSDVAIDGTTIAFTTYFQINGQTGYALLYVFAYNGTAWVKTARLESSSLDLGGAMALRGNTLVTATNQRANVYSLVGSAWTKKQTLNLSWYRVRFPDITLSGTELIVDSANFFELGNDGMWQKSATPVPSSLARGENDIATFGDRVFLGLYGSLETYVRENAGWKLEHSDVIPSCCNQIEANERYIISTWPFDSATTLVIDRTISAHAPQPRFPTADAQGINPIQVPFVWQGVDQANSYELQILRPFTSDDSPLFAVTVSDTSAKVTLPEYDVTVRWRVRANFDFGPGVWSEDLQFSTMPRLAGVGNWEDRFSEFGPDSTVLALARSPLQGLFVGGVFAESNIMPASYLALWTGIAWLPLGEGVNGPVTHLALDSNQEDLYVAGSFTTAGGLSSAGLARWNFYHQTWDPFVFPISGTIRDMVFDSQDEVSHSLYVAVETEDGKGRVYKWTPSQDRQTGQRSTIGEELPQPIRTMDVEAGRIVIGFGQPDGQYGSSSDCAIFGCMAESRGASWVPIDASAPIDSVASVDHIVFAFDQVHVAGRIAWTIDGSPVSYLAQYDGQSWSKHGEGLQAPVTALDNLCQSNCTFGYRNSQSNDLLVVGAEVPGGVRMWNRGDWFTPEQGVDGTAYAFAAVDSEGSRGAYVGGSFYLAGGLPSNNLARWRMALPVSTEPVETLPAHSTSVVVYPNPTAGQATVVIENALPHLGQLAVFDMLGRLRQINRDLPLAAGKNQFSVDLAGLPSGLYLIRLETETGRISAKIIKAE